MSTYEEEIETHFVDAPRVNQFRSIITIGLTRCNSERREMTHFAELYVHLHVCVRACAHVRVLGSALAKRGRREPLQRSLAAIAASLLHYSSPKWMMQIMFRANSRVYMHARERLVRVYVKRVWVSLFSRVGVEQRLPIRFDLPIFSYVTRLWRWNKFNKVLKDEIKSQFPP